MKKQNSALPIFIPDFTEIAKQMRINNEILKEEITNHVNTEVLRFKKEIQSERAKKK